MSRRRSNALTDMSYYGEVPDEDGQHAIYARPISADSPDNLTGKVAHRWNGVEGSTVANDHQSVLRERLPQGIGEPWLQHSQLQTALSSRRRRVYTSTQMIGAIPT